MERNNPFLFSWVPLGAQFCMNFIVSENYWIFKFPENYIYFSTILCKHSNTYLVSYDLNPYKIYYRFYLFYLIMQKKLLRMFNAVDCLRVRNSIFMSMCSEASLFPPFWLNLYVNLAGPQGAQTLGQTLFWVCLRE